MEAVYVFPGQGSQRRGMGKGLFEKYQSLIEQADQLLGYSIKELCLNDPERLLNKTQYTQPALYTVNVLSYLDKLEEGKITPKYVAGHSLGEYSALFAAGAFDFITGLKLVQKRGALMSLAGNGGMAAIVNVDQYRVKEILKSLPFDNIEVANINSKHQCIISGLYDEVFSAEVERTFEEAGAQLVPLNVRTAFHSGYMKDAQKEFETFLSNFEFKPLKLSVISNYSARPYPTTNYEQHLSLQISHSVKWYESISWLIKQGQTKFTEVGPGDVLTKLTKRILEAPMNIEDDSGKLSKNDSSKTVNNIDQKSYRKIIFMYGGQGAQYYQMGRELFDTNPVFRKNMTLCSDMVSQALNFSLIDVIYNQSKVDVELDNIMFSHPALFSIGFSLTQTLLAEGIEPYGVLGYSLGEYIAATIAKTISLEDGLNLVIAQAKLLQANCNEGGMLSVLDSTELFKTHSDLFDNLTVGGENFSNNFFVSGLNKDLENTKLLLSKEETACVRLPVRYGFHSSAIDSIKDDFIAYTANVKRYTPSIPIYSSFLERQLDDGILESFDTYLWDIIRKESNFSKLIASSFDPNEDYFFVDLSPTATLSTFLKHGFGKSISHGFVINQFGKNTDSFKKLIATLTD